MKTKNLLLAGAAGLGTFMLYKRWNKKKPAPCPKKAIQNWVDTVCKHNPNDIVNLYAPDGVLLGTVADNIKKGRGQIIEYFNMFVQKKPCGEITSIMEQNDGNIATVDGTYTFKLTNEDGSVKEVPARFTFVLRNIGGEWLIATHHSSKQPNI